jgi:hypothetical protein
MHEDTMDIFCDSTYTNMAEPFEICGQTEIVENNMIICRRDVNHFDDHRGPLHGVELLWD